MVPKNEQVAHFQHRLPEKQFQSTHFWKAIMISEVSYTQGNWPSGSGEKDFEISSMYFFCYYLSLEKDMALHLSELESPSQPRMLCAKFF